jgi:cytochrome c oxidase subunit 2
MKQFLASYMGKSASAHGQHLDDLTLWVHWLMLILFVGWGLYFIYALYRFSAKRNPKASYAGMQSHISTYTEAGVAVVEVILLVGFSIPAWYSWTTPPPPAAHPLEIRAVGEQFAWNIHYPGADGIFGRADVKLVTSTNPLGLDPTDPHAKDDIAATNQLHLEVNRPVIIHVSSKDVIHSFKLPVMRAEQDAIPGMSVAIHFTPVRMNNGQEWDIQCAQLCGIGHYRMKGMITVETKEQFQAWLASQPPVVANL